MRIIVCGSRSFADHQTEECRGLLRHLFTTLDPGRDTIITGGAKGVDQIANEVAQELGLLTEVYHANWTALPRSGGLVRNRYMITRSPDLVLAVWDGHSSGTFDMIQVVAPTHGVPVERHVLRGET